MRKLAWLAALISLLAAGCRTAAPKPSAVRSFPGLAELGRPWPVLIGSFAGPLSIISHEPAGLLFETPGRIRHQLDYARRRLVHLGFHAGNGRDEETRLPIPRVDNNQEPAGLYLEWPDGRRTEVARGLAAAKGFALSKDGGCLAYYQDSPTGIQLIIYRPEDDARTIWRHLGRVPAVPKLSWSPDDRYLLEDSGDRLLIHCRESGWAVGPVVGNTPLFDPAGRYLLFKRADQRPGLLNLQTGADWPLLAAGERWLPPYRAVWRRDGTALFIQAASNDPGRHLLYRYETATGSLRRYETDDPVDLRRYAALLDAPPNRLRALLDLLPTLKGGPLSEIKESFYLAGRGGQLILLDPQGRIHELARFPARITALSLTRDRRRLVVAAGGRERTTLYAWRLPDPAILAGPFPDRRDLGLGRLTLGMNEAEAVKVLGPPPGKETGMDPRNGRQTATWRYPDLSVVFSAQGRLIRMIDSSPGLRTTRGIGIGSSLAEIFELYGRPAYRSGNYLSYQGAVEGNGIKVAFTLDQTKKVAAILVARVED